MSDKWVKLSDAVASVEGVASAARFSEEVHGTDAVEAATTAAADAVRRLQVQARTR